MKEILDCDNWISWRRRNEDFALKLDDGDPVVVTISPNGHDAAASILSHPGECKHVPAQNWFTIESLGAKSVIHYKADTSDEESPRKTGIRGHVKKFHWIVLKLAKKPIDI